jgi:hypothetical protein
MALSLFALLFSAGLLLDSKPYLDELRKPAQQVSSADSLPHVSSGPALAAFLDLPGVSQLRAALNERRVTAFFKAMLLYAPTNALLLTLLAGFLGGCASNLTYESAKEKTDESKEKADVAKVSAGYMQETPFASMIRSLVVYLLFRAGMFIAAGDPFPAPKEPLNKDKEISEELKQAEQNARANQYVRFAATISAFAFAVGYDPRRLAELLRGLPGSK